MVGATAPQLAQPTTPRRESGYVQLGVSYEEPQLMVALWAAEGLRVVESQDDVALPRPYAVVRLGIYGYSPPSKKKKKE